MHILRWYIPSMAVQQCTVQWQYIFYTKQERICSTPRRCHTKQERNCSTPRRCHANEIVNRPCNPGLILLLRQTILWFAIFNKISPLWLSSKHAHTRNHTWISKTSHINHTESTDLRREHWPAKNTERAELVLQLPSGHPGIQVADVQAGHHNRSPANHSPETDTDSN